MTLHTGHTLDIEDPLCGNARSAPLRDRLGADPHELGKPGLAAGGLGRDLNWMDGVGVDEHGGKLHRRLMFVNPEFIAPPVPAARIGTYG